MMIVLRFLSLLIALIFSDVVSDYQVAAQGIVRDTVIAHPGQDKELTCDVNGTEESTHWQINGSSTLISLSDLLNGAVAGHNRSGRNIVVKDIVMNDDRNGSLYQCVVVATPTMGGKLIILYVAGVPSIVPNVTISDVPYILSWREPFNNLDPIVHYTVLCSGDDTCPLNMTTTDNTTRSYNISNLTSMNNYTFSVVATNSVGSGEASVVMLITPGPPDRVPDVMVDEKSDGSNVTLTLSWGQPFSYSGPIISYTVSCSGDVICPLDFTTPDNTTRSYTITNLTLTTYLYYVFLVVATNSMGNGKAGVRLYPTQVISAISQPMCTPAVSELYNITVTCTIHPDSTTKLCVVIAMADDGDTKAGNASVTEGIATVVINDLQCGVTYNITAEGMLNKTLVGFRSSHDPINPGPCPTTSIDKESDDEFSTGVAVTISVVVTLIITLVVTALITCIITSLYYKHMIIKSLTTQKIDSHSLTEDINRHDPTTVSTNITMDPNPAYGNTSTIKMNTNPAYGDIDTIKMGTNPAYDTTSH